MIYIYLDTNFLSELSKTACDKKQEARGIEKWRAILNVLCQRTKSGLLTCPASQFQTQEVMLADDLTPYN
jgi:hypothetical protein